MNGRDIRNILSVIAVAVIINGAVGWSALHWAPARDAAALATLAYVIIEYPWIAGGARRMLAAAALAAVAALVFLPDPLSVLRRALAEAAFVTGLFTTLGMLRDCAHSSPLIRRCGEQMVRQRPGRRYAALSLGSHLISVVLNFGVLGLLGTMIVKGNTLEAAEGDEIVQGIRERRMMTAILRGFAMMTVWSPLAVSFTVVQQVIPDLAWWRLLPLQLGLGLVLMLWGWALDRIDFPPHTRRLQPARHKTDFGPMIRLITLVAAVVAAALSVAELAGTRLVVGAMIVVPPAAVLWLYVQQTGPVAWRVVTTGRLFLRRVSLSLPNFRSEVAMLGGAMFLGTVVASFIPAEDAARAVAAIPLPPIAIAVLLAWTVMAAAQVGISQFVTITLMGSAVGSLIQTGVSPIALAGGLLAAWALSVCTTPVGAAVMMVARMSEVPVRTVSQTWNGRFVLVGAGLIAVWMVGLSLIL